MKQGAGGGKRMGSAPVGRAGYKLADAIGAFGVDFRGKLVLDIGASTGGFTEAALKAGAARVVAVEKGTRQMKAPLRFDPRVELHEKTDIFEFSWANVQGLTEVGAGELLTKHKKFDIIVGDISFVSLTKVLFYAKNHLASAETEFLVMLKPQFEAKPWQLREGVVKNNKIRREIIVNFEAWLKRAGFVILGKRDNVLAGRFGNVERFYYLKISDRMRVRKKDKNEK